MGILRGKFATLGGYTEGEAEYDFTVPVSEWMEKQDEWAKYTLQYVEMENLFDLETGFYSNFSTLYVDETGRICGTSPRVNTCLVKPDATVYVHVPSWKICTFADLMLRKFGGGL